jgi:hypothetical protein
MSGAYRLSLWQLECMSTMFLRSRAARQARECCNTKCQVARLITRCHPLLIQYIHVAVSRS